MTRILRHGARVLLFVLIIGGLALPSALVAQQSLPQAESCRLVSALHAASGPWTERSAALARARTALDSLSIARLDALRADPVLAPFLATVTRELGQVSRAVVQSDPELLPTRDPSVTAAFAICARAGLVEASASVDDSVTATATNAAAPRARLRAVDLEAPDDRRSFMLAGFAIFGLASYLMHRRNLRVRRQTRRRLCHLPTEVRVGGITYATTLRDISQMGAGLALCASGPLALRTRVWLRIDRAWVSSRVQWQNKAGFGLRFDHPIRMSQIETLLADGVTARPGVSGNRGAFASVGQRSASTNNLPAAFGSADTGPTASGGANRLAPGISSGSLPDAEKINVAFHSRRDLPAQGQDVRSDPEGPKATRH